MIAQHYRQHQRFSRITSLISDKRAKYLLRRCSNLCLVGLQFLTTLLTSWADCIASLSKQSTICFDCCATSLWFRAASFHSSSSSAHFLAGSVSNFFWSISSFDLFWCFLLLRKGATCRQAPYSLVTFKCKWNRSFLTSNFHHFFRIQKFHIVD